MKTVLDDVQVRIESWLSETEERSLANDVLDGLTRPFKEMPPKSYSDVTDYAFYWYFTVGVWIPLYVILYVGPRFF